MWQATTGGGQRSQDMTFYNKQLEGKTIIHLYFDRAFVIQNSTSNKRI